MFISKNNLKYIFQFFYSFLDSTEPSKGTKEIKKEKAKKAKNPSKSFKRVFSYAWRNKEYLFTGLIGLLFSSLSSAVMP